MKWHVYVIVSGLVFALATPALGVRREWASTDDSWVELVSATVLGAGSDYPGAWEYIYDVYGGANSLLTKVRLEGLDTYNILNLNTASGGWGTDVTGVYQNWDARSVLSGETGPYDRYPSTWQDTNGDSVADAWVDASAAPATDWAMPNAWHTGDEYTLAPWGLWEPAYYYPGVIYGQGTGEEGLSWERSPSIYIAMTGLNMTFRIVHPSPPTTNLYETEYNNGDEVYGFLDGPGDST